MIDIAYQGFGDGLNKMPLPPGYSQRAAGMFDRGQLFQNFGIYRERTGVLMVVSQDQSAQALNQGTLAYLNRQNFRSRPTTVRGW